MFRFFDLFDKTQMNILTYMLRKSLTTYGFNTDARFKSLLLLFY